MAVNYIVLRDQILPVGMGAGSTIDFELPADAVINNQLQAPIVSFMVNNAMVTPGSGGGDLGKPNTWSLQLAVEVNDRRISAYRFWQTESNTSRVIQEAMDPNTNQRRLNHGRNTLQFEIEGGGMVFVQDIVVWYHTS